MAVMKLITEVMRVWQQKIDSVGYRVTVDYGSKSSLCDSVPAGKSFLAYLIVVHSLLNSPIGKTLRQKTALKSYADLSLIDFTLHNQSAFCLQRIAGF